MKSPITLDDLYAEVIGNDPILIARHHQSCWIQRILHQLISLRLAQGVTRSELAQRLDVPKKWVKRFETGDDAHLSDIFEYLAALDLEPSTLANLALVEVRDAG